MSVISLRGLSPDLVESLKAEARREQTSMNRYIVNLIQDRLGGNQAGKPRVYHDLDDLFGTMTLEDAQAIEESVAAQRQIDPELWS